MSLPIRPLTSDDEVRTAFDVFLRAMVGLPIRDVDARTLVEPGRQLGAFDGDRLVGTVDSYTSWLTVPGGQRVPHAAVTHVGVLPTHTRRGIVTALVTEQLRDIAARGEVLASLRASEAVIYERFGYAVASSSTSARLARRRGGLRATVPASGQVRIADGAEGASAVPALYDRAAWVGSIRRPDEWWRLRRLGAAHDLAPTYTVIHSTDGTDDGYAVYTPVDTHGWFTSAERVVTVSDFVALSESAYRGLLRHFLDLDLVDVVAFASLPVDDPLPTLLADQRALTWGSPRDETWLRIIDVERALAARTFDDGDPVVLRVTDDRLPGNEGCYEIGPKTVTRTDAEPDLVADVAALAAAYLGGTGWWQLARAGRVEERTPGAVGRADRLFATPRAPFAGTSF
ncbi:GNAT family N-acetyltransferase [Nocardioides sp. CER19]|uniref:GNAT family N-acetyltransferase n=1 Tax=Nocardioides sp. CER19 TaxID=3038538 RepID=UPI002447E0AB|nr:GNAT family N-acetyltransferase [Nocardioides sp. CER19]MDH2414156.1 GNAT family N-acetyltransferase [Nocardioides sp. CER19]